MGDEFKNVGAIILAGGQGTRFGQKKQFVELNGKPLWQHVYDKVATLLPKNMIVVVGVDVEGGKTRSLSVRNGLKVLPECDKVVLLEAARPMVTIEQILLLIKTQSESITFVSPCVDTIIMKDKTYINRADCYRMQTPQACSYIKLKEAYNTEKYLDMTDETRVMFEEYGIVPTFIDGSENLYKVTYPKDIFIIENFL